MFKFTSILLSALLLTGCSTSVPAANTPQHALPAGFAETSLTESWEEYGDLDQYGRATYAEANIGQDLMPTSQRESISSVKPSGWMFNGKSNNIKISGEDTLYNRCHLIAFCLTGENANEKNLVTGTRQMNTAMIPYETEIAQYVEQTGNHVYYKVVPNYTGSNLVCDSVTLSAKSVEDNGAKISFDVTIPNTQDGYSIDYATGQAFKVEENTQTWTVPADSTAQQDFILNKSSGKIHLPDCEGVKKMSEKNREEFHGTLQQAIDQGYDPCGICLKGK
ncbi:MAG: DNA/RNA non-specific endonuclease [Erysipelotrichaceae bacterium]|nr:DNA/RNA non-specific endonuclease [Erysipelotrichaceae bacterium]